MEHTENRETYATTLNRATLGADRLENVEQLLVATPFGKSTSNFGGALAFDADGYLYFTTGDRSERDNAVDTSLLTGKVLRLTADGEVPPDNPFVDNPEIDDRIYAYGVRNPQGLVFDSQTGRLFSTEHGPMGGDEVNIMQGGKNYGWPVITYGANYSIQRIGVGTSQPGMEQPLYYYLPSLGISPLEIYRGEMFPEWQGHLLVGALKGSVVSKLTLLDQQILSDQRMLDELGGRVRDIKVAQDGSIYFLVQTGNLFRLYRDPKRKNNNLQSMKERNGKVVYEMVCASCHSAELPGIPQIGDSDAWQQRLADKGKATLYDNTINGINGMPERGLCAGCSDNELKQAVDYIFKQSKPESQAGQE